MYKFVCYFSCKFLAPSVRHFVGWKKNGDNFHYDEVSGSAICMHNDNEWRQIMNEIIGYADLMSVRSLRKNCLHGFSFFYSDEEIFDTIQMENCSTIF